VTSAASAAGKTSSLAVLMTMHLLSSIHTKIGLNLASTEQFDGGINFCIGTALSKHTIIYTL
jgi:hypothetical protein